MTAGRQTKKRTHHLQVHTQQGVVGHPECTFATRPDGTLRIRDANGVERRVYASGYWSHLLIDAPRPTTGDL